MLVGDGEIAGGGELLVDLQTVLIGVRVLHVGIHGADAEAEVAGQGERGVAGDDVREDGCVGLAIGERERGERVRRDGGPVAVGLERVGERAQRDAVIEEAKAAANDGAAILEWRVGKAEAGRDVLGVGVDGLEPLQVVANAGVEGELRVDLPLVLRIHAEVGVGLRHDEVAEGLGEGGVLACLEVGQRGEAVAAPVGHGEGDGEVVEEEVSADANRVRSDLTGEVVDDLVEAVVASSGRAGGGAEGGTS